jgi:hypothetical protein
MIAATEITTPPMVDTSTRDLVAIRLLASWYSFAGLQDLWITENAPPVLDHFPYYFFSGFEDHKLLAIEQMNDGIWRRLNLFNEIRVQHEWRPVDSGEMDHAVMVLIGTGDAGLIDILG